MCYVTHLEDGWSWKGSIKLKAKGTESHRKIMTTAKDAHSSPLLRKGTSIPICQVHWEIKIVFYTHCITLNQSEMH